MFMGEWVLLQRQFITYIYIKQVILLIYYMLFFNLLTDMTDFFIRFYNKIKWKYVVGIFFKCICKLLLTLCMFYVFYKIYINKFIKIKIIFGTVL